MSKDRKFLPVLLIGLLPISALVLIGYIGSFTRYMADDYCSVYWAQRFGLFRSVWYWYISWSGRFSAYASDWFIMLIGSRNVRLVPPIALAIWLGVTVLAIYLFLRRLGTNTFLFGAALLSAVIFLFVVFLLMPDIQQSFLWWNGMRSYTLPLILLTLFAVLFQLSIDRLKTRRMILLACLFSFLYLFANAGLSDTFAVTQFALLAILAAWRIFLARKRDERDASLAILIAGIVGTMLALVVIIVAPGNAVREAALQPHLNLLDVFMVAFQGTQGHGMSWLSLLQNMVNTPERWLALIGIIFVVAWAGSIQRRLALDLYLVPAFAALGVILSYVSFLPASWGTSEPPPTRTLSVAEFALIACLFPMAFIAGNWFSAKINPRTVMGVLLVPAIFAITISAVMNIQELYQSRETYITFAERWDVAENQILEAKASHQESVTVPSWKNWAGLEVFSDNSKNWLNVCASGYYGIRVIGETP